MVDRRPLIAYAALSSLAAIIASLPGVALVLAIPTLGLSFFVLSIWMYSTALIPGFVFRNSRLPWNLIGWVLPVGLVALGPGVIAAGREESIVSSYTSDDFSRSLPIRPKNIELIGRKQGLRVKKDDDLIQHAPCDEICQRLLTTRQVETVTAATPMPKGEWLVVTYRLAAMDTCPMAFARGVSVLPSTTRSSIEGLCIVPFRGEHMEQGVVIRPETLQIGYIPGFSLNDVKSASRLTVWEKKDGKDGPLLRQTELVVGSAQIPFMIHPYAGFMTTVSGVAVAKHQRVVNPQTYLTVMEKLGFAILPADSDRHAIPLPAAVARSDPALEIDQKMVRSILSRPDVEPFNLDLQSVFGEWTARYWEGKAGSDPGVQTLMNEIILDKRISHIGKSAWRSPAELVVPLLNALVRRLEWPVSALDDGGGRPIAQLVMRQDEAALAPYARRLIGIANDNLSATTSPLLVFAARSGTDGVPSLLAGLKSKNRQIRNDAIVAACHAKPDITPRLTNAMQMMLREGNDGNPTLILALASLTGVKDAQAEIQNLPNDQKRRLQKALDGATSSGSVSCPEML